MHESRKVPATLVKWLYDLPHHRANMMQRGEKQNQSGAEGELIPANTPPPKINLQNAAAIRRELAAVYRDARAGKIETQDATSHVKI